MLKVAYISPTYFSNVDISFIEEMRKQCDVHYYPIMNAAIKGCAIEPITSITKPGIYDAKEYRELDRFHNFVDIQKTRIVYRTQGKHTLWENLRVTLQLCRELKAQHFDIIHITEVLRFTEWPLLQFRKKMVMSVHDPFRHSHQHSRLVELYRKLDFHCLSHFILFNKSQKEDFVRYYHLQNKQIYISLLSVYSYLKIYNSTREAATNHYALFLGKIYSYKGLEYLFPAMEMIHQKYPDFKLIVAGGGKFYFDISKYKDCGYIEIRNRYYDDAEQAELIANSDFIVCPYSDATQSGVIMSAYAFDKPCLVTRTGGLPEMVGDGKYGIIVSPRNTEELAEAMCKMIDQPELLQEFAKKIHSEYYEGEKSWKHATEDIYKDIYTQI